MNTFFDPKADSTFMFDWKKAREAELARLEPERRQILEEFEYLVGHPCSDALRECLSEILDGRDVRIHGGLVTCDYRPDRLNLGVDDNKVITRLFFR